MLTFVSRLRTLSQRPNRAIPPGGPGRGIRWIQRSLDEEEQRFVIEPLNLRSGRSQRRFDSRKQRCEFRQQVIVLAARALDAFAGIKTKCATQFLFPVVWAISQTLEDFVGTERQPRLHGPGIVKNSTTKIIGQQRGDLALTVTFI
jgi:hypothetical protein